MFSGKKKTAQLPERLTQISGGRTSGVKVDGGRLRVVLDVSGMAADDREALDRAIRDEAAKAGVSDVQLMMTAERKDRRLIAVGSGKGGVGKSTLSTNLAVAMAAAGRKVGLVDADITGPSQARLLAADTSPEAKGNVLVPVMGAGNVPFLSMGQIVPPDAAIAWRGPMLSKALKQLFEADWNAADELIVDLPPGTGDVQLSMIQQYRPAGAVIVSTPQDLALLDARRAIDFFAKANVPVIGMVENMAGYVCPECGAISDPFGKGGAEAAAKELGIDFLGRVPLTMGIRSASDAGTPPALDRDGEGAVFHELAAKLGAWLDRQEG